MNRGILALLVIFLIFVLFIYDRFGKETVDDFADDIQAYQEKSLLPEDY